VIASGDLGELFDPPKRLIWYAEAGIETAELISRTLVETALPWMEIFHSPLSLKGKLYSRSLPLVDDCTALELLLSQFDPFEGRRFLLTRRDIVPEKGPFSEPEGYTFDPIRLNSIAASYRLRI
jgi:hypothetical protein